MQRSEKIHDQVEQLRRIKYFEDSLISRFEKRDYIDDNTIIEYMIAYAQQLRSLKEKMKNETDKCGDLTKEEKQILAKLTEFGY